MTKRAALYLRVSTDKQTTENQKLELERIAKRSKWTVVEIYKDEGISGLKTGSARPAFQQLKNDATKRKFDVVMAWSVDRLGRSLRDLVNFLEDMRALNVDLYLHRQSIDTSTATGKAFLAMAAVFAEFERDAIVERVKAGLDRAKAQGKTLGRPGLDDRTKTAVLSAHAKGLSIRQIAKDAEISVGAVHKILQQQSAVKNTARKKKGKTTNNKTVKGKP